MVISPKHQPVQRQRIRKMISIQHGLYTPEIIQNDKLAEHWEVGNKWNEFEIITGLKDMEIIKKL